MSDTALAWWCARPDRRLRYDDQRLALPGDVHSFQPIAPGAVPSLCYRGMHASRRAFDALYYAAVFTEEAWLYRVKIHGIVEEDAAKLVGYKREYLWAVPPTSVDAVVRHALACRLRRSPNPLVQHAANVLDWELAGKASQRQRQNAVAAAHDGAPVVVQELLEAIEEPAATAVHNISPVTTLDLDPYFRDWKRAHP